MTDQANPAEEQPETPKGETKVSTPKATATKQAQSKAKSDKVMMRAVRFTIYDPYTQLNLPGGVIKEVSEDQISDWLTAQIDAGLVERL